MSASVTDGIGVLSSPMALSPTCELPAWRVDLSEQPGAASQLAACAGWPAVWGQAPGASWRMFKMILYHHFTFSFTFQEKAL